MRSARDCDNSLIQRGETRYKSCCHCPGQQCCNQWVELHKYTFLCYELPGRRLKNFVMKFYFYAIYEFSLKNGIMKSPSHIRRVIRLMRVLKTNVYPDLFFNEDMTLQLPDYLEVT